MQYTQIYRYRKRVSEKENKLEIKYRDCNMLSSQFNWHELHLLIFIVWFFFHVSSRFSFSSSFLQFVFHIFHLIEFHFGMNHKLNSNFIGLKLRNWIVSRYLTAIYHIEHREHRQKMWQIKLKLKLQFTNTVKQMGNWC